MEFDCDEHARSEEGLQRYPSQWVVIASIAGKLGCTSEKRTEGAAS